MDDHYFLGELTIQWDKDTRKQKAKILCDNKGQHPGGALGSEAWGVGTQDFSRKWCATEARRLTELTGCGAGGGDWKGEAGELSTKALRGHFGELQIASKG